MSPLYVSSEILEFNLLVRPELFCFGDQAEVGWLLFIGFGLVVF